MSIGLAPGFAPLLRARDYAEISQLAERELKPPVTPEAARLANLALARIAYERGDFAESAGRFEAAAQAAPDDPWLEAEAIECRYREAYLDSAMRERIADELDARLDRDASPPLLWARARIRSGIHPDERPTPDALRGADADLEDAERQEASPEVLLARVRIKRILSRADASDRVALLDQARRYLHDVRRRLPPEDDPNRLRVTPPDVALEYEDGRLRLAEEHWDEAKARFEAVLRHDPGHQSANVWSIYAKRMTSAAEAELIAEIDHVLGDPTLHAGRWSVAPAALPDARRGVVVAPEMEAELLTERAAILETGDEDAWPRR